MLLAASFVIGVAASAMVDACGLAFVDVSGDDLPRMLGVPEPHGIDRRPRGPGGHHRRAAWFGFGWEAPFLLAAVLMAAYGVWLARSPLPPPHHRDERESPHRAVASILRDRRVWLFGVMATLLGRLDEPFLAFLIARLQRTDGMSRTLATAIAMLTVVGAAIGALEQARHAPPNPPLVRPAILVAVAVTLIALAPSAVLVLPGALVFGFGMIGFWTALQARVLLLRPGQAGTVSAVVSTIEFSGFLIPIGIGVVVTPTDCGRGSPATPCWPSSSPALVIADRSRSGNFQLVAS